MGPRPKNSWRKRRKSPSPSESNPSMLTLWTQTNWEPRPRSFGKPLSDLRPKNTLVLLLDGVAVTGALGRVDELVRQALGDRLDVAERGFSSSSAQQPNCLIDPPERRHIDGLPPHGAGTPDPSRVFSGSRVDDGVDENLKRILAGEEMDDLEAVLDDADGHELLTVVAAVHHQRVHKALNNGAPM